MLMAIWRLLPRIRVPISDLQNARKYKDETMAGNHTDSAKGKMELRLRRRAKQQSTGDQVDLDHTKGDFDTLSAVTSDAICNKHGEGIIFEMSATSCLPSKIILFLRLPAGTTRAQYSQPPNNHPEKTPCLALTSARLMHTLPCHLPSLIWVPFNKITAPGLILSPLN